MSRAGIYGGTFDPVHNGHLITAQCVRELRSLDKVIFIPNRISPLKQELKVSEPEHRMNMLKLAIKNIPYFDLSDFEIKRKNVSYTIDTLHRIKQDYEEIELIIGADNINTFDRWKSPEEIIELATLLVLKRRTENEPDVHNKFIKDAVLLETPVIDISGTVIRERVRRGLPIDFLVPQDVMKYIYDLKLYKDL
ncbi:MAG TPA: nicotinate-nucleotide adenylyltransferase [Ignavibacteriaceae bacterium]|nr:nicotinate-nucleotide adenylyltransferase [Ignavibacteriaceae bacterium]